MKNPVALFAKNLKKGLEDEVFSCPNIIPDLKKASETLPLTQVSGNFVFSSGFGFSTGRMDLPHGRIKLSAFVEYDFGSSLDNAPITQFKIAFKFGDDNIEIGDSVENFTQVVVKTLEALGIEQEVIQTSLALNLKELDSISTALVKFTSKVDKFLSK